MPSSFVQAHRYHDFSYGHRVFGHENKCGRSHGHNGRVHFYCQGERDHLGRVIDFGVMKTLLCDWVETCWDHRFLLWEEDPWLEPFLKMDPSILIVPFNPTAENMALHLLEEIGPRVLSGTGVCLVKVVMEETRKCSATAEID